MSSEHANQMTLDFERPNIEPDGQAKPDSQEDPANKPGAFWNGKIWVSDEDLAF